MLYNSLTVGGREYTLGCELKLFSHSDRIHYFFSQVNIPLCTSPSLSLTWENSRHFVPPLVSLQNDVGETSTEITTQIWVALMIGWKFASSNQRHYLDRVSDTVIISMEFLRSFFRRHFMGRPPVASQNVYCLLRLLYHLFPLTFTCIMRCFCIDIPESDGCITWATRQISICMTALKFLYSN